MLQSWIKTKDSCTDVHMQAKKRRKPPTQMYGTHCLIRKHLVPRRFLFPTNTKILSLLHVSNSNSRFRKNPGTNGEFRENRGPCQDVATRHSWGPLGTRETTAWSFPQYLLLSISNYPCCTIANDGPEEGNKTSLHNWGTGCIRGVFSCLKVCDHEQSWDRSKRMPNHPPSQRGNRPRTMLGFYFILQTPPPICLSLTRRV